MKLVLKNTSIEFRHYEFEPKNYGIAAFSVNKLLTVNSGGEVVEIEMTGYASTPMLPMKGASSIAYCTIPGKSGALSFVYYDEDGNVVSYVQTLAGGNNANNFAYTDSNIPSDACYVRACCYISGSTAPYVNIS